MRHASARARVSAPLVLAAILAGCASPAMGVAQQPTTSAPAPAPAAAPVRPGPEVGTLAPDFSLPAATRFGRTVQPFRLSDFRGQTVVLAFFSRARTRG